MINKLAGIMLLIVAMVYAVVVSGCNKKVVVASGYIDSPVVMELNVPMPVEEKIEIPEPIIEMDVPQPIYFDFDKFELLPQYDHIIYYARDYINKNPDYTLVIEGHCDARGSNSYNYVLGLKRADAVRTALNEDGIDIVSYGEDRLSECCCGDDGCHRLNRRVEFKKHPKRGK